jgi:hypothetical protein
MSERHPDSQRGLDSPRGGQLALRGVAVICALLVASDFAIEKHGHYGFETWIGFQGFYGFVACVALVLVAKQIRRVVKRDRDYYDD